MAKYKFLNINPLGKREEDCVCRAISLAVNEDYNIISRKLELIAELYECDMLCVCCYKKLLDTVYNLERIEEFDGRTVEEFLDAYPSGIYLIRLDNHLTCAIDGVIYDLWNCLQEPIRIVWVVDKP